jgi:16S rRNA (cytidine1402-2'-O)-methyltransferase
LTVGTLYVVGVPLGDLNDLTQRAVRILGQVAFVVADDVDLARRLLAHQSIGTPVIAAAGEAALGALESGDVALLCPGWSSEPKGPGDQLVRATIERGFPVVSIPGPSLPITALVISGLPADAFVYLGELPHEGLARRQLLNSVADERRTLVALLSRPCSSAALVDLPIVLGDRPAAVVTASELGTDLIWEGSLGQVPGQLPELQASDPAVLVIGGAPSTVGRWEEAKIRAEIQNHLAQGRGAREISHQLAAESGWSKREIYRIAIQVMGSETSARRSDR